MTESVFMLSHITNMNRYHVNETEAKAKLKWNFPRCAVFPELQDA